jgi:uncharacterized membrane protein/GT2 family glycosyltransferase
MSELTISVVIPVRNGGAPFRRCLAAFANSTLRPHELIVVDDGSTDGSPRWAKDAGALVLAVDRPGGGPALARNAGARRASGDLLFFVDADVEIRPDTLAHIRRAFMDEPGLAALFGSYDDAPADPGFVSQYKNLMHHYVHQQASDAAQASTFWSGCGAIRRELFLRYGGFSPRYAIPSIEDIELGSALAQAGGRIRLDKALQVKHLKRWTLPSLLHSDVVARAIPWTRLILRLGRMPNDLNLQTSSRVSVALVYIGLLCALISFIQPWAWLGVLATTITLLVMNRAVYGFFLEKRGPLFVLGAVGMHWLYYAYSGLAFGLGVLAHLAHPKPAIRLGQWALLAILMLAAGLRFHRLGAQSLWLDELLQIETSAAPVTEIVQRVPSFSAMPLDYLVTHLALQFGAQDFWLRLAPALWSVLTIAMLYRFVERLLGRGEGLIAALLMSVTQFSVHYAQEARPYALWGLLALTSFYFLFRALRTNRPAHWLGYALSAALALLTHLFTLFMLITQAGLVLIGVLKLRQPVRSRLARFGLAALAVVSALFLTPYPGSVLGVGQVFASNLLNPQAFSAPPELKPNQEAGPILNAEFFHDHLLIGLGGSGAVWPWAFLALVLVGLAALARRQPRLALQLGVWAAAPITLTTAFLIQRGTFSAVRYLTPAYLALMILLAIGTAGLVSGLISLVERWFRLNAASRGAVWLAVLTPLVLLNLNSVSDYYQTPKEDWRAAGRFIDANVAPGDSVASPLGGGVIFYYAPRARAGRTDTALPEGLPPTAGRIWYVRHPYLGPIGEAWEAWLDEHPAVEYRVDESLSVFVLGPSQAETLAEITPPDTVLAWATLGEEYAQLDDYEHAEASFRRALALSDAPEFKTTYADYLRQHGQSDAAAAYYLQALERDRDWVPALVGLGRIYLQRNLPNDAVQALEWAVQHAPDDYAANYFVAQAYDRLDRPADAARHRERAGQIIPDLLEPP